MIFDSDTCVDSDIIKQNTYSLVDPPHFKTSSYATDSRVSPTLTSQLNLVLSSKLAHELSNKLDHTPNNNAPKVYNYKASNSKLSRHVSSKYSHQALINPPGPSDKGPTSEQRPSGPSRSWSLVGGSTVYMMSAGLASAFFNTPNVNHAITT